MVDKLSVTVPILSLVYFNKVLKHLHLFHSLSFETSLIKQSYELNLFQSRVFSILFRVTFLFPYWSKLVYILLLFFFSFIVFTFRPFGTKELKLFSELSKLLVGKEGVCYAFRSLALAALHFREENVFLLRLQKIDVQ